jgi:tRNA modification GTPase
MYLKNDTIVAIATPIGEGGISVIRISGRDAFQISDKGFQGKQPLSLAKSHTVHFGTFRNAKAELIDEVIATVFIGPNTYSGEDVIEISCHGGIYITQRILQELVLYGCRHAEPGEFTFRAFANGRIDLSQAEAVADLIHSQSESAHKMSIQNLRGSLSEKIDKLKKLIIHYCGLLELELDFSEEDIRLASREEMVFEIKKIISSIDELLATYNTGRIFREGMKVVLIGPPNVGKSSILNALLGHDRAIVTSIPGTTRDKIEEKIVFDGILIRIVDTAGLRESSDPIEIEGFKKTHEEISEADIILFVIDHTVNDKLLGLDIFSKILKTKTCLIVLNKIDLQTEEEKKINHTEHTQLIKISALTGENIQLLKETITKTIVSTNRIDFNNSPALINQRQKKCLENTRKSLLEANNGILKGITNELVAEDLRGAIRSFSEITGQVTSDEILNDIFSNFCIGK